MSFSWGGFAQGIGYGVNLADKIGKEIDDARIAKVRSDAMAEAKQARQNAVADMVKDNGISPRYVNGTTPDASTGTKTGDTAPDTPDVQTAAVAQPTTTITSPQPASAPAPAIRPTGPAQDMADAPVPAAPQSATPAPAAPAAPASVAASGIGGSSAPVRKRYSVGDASFDTMEEARAHAEKNAPTVTDLFLKNAAPKISAAYLEQGDADKAEAWDQYAKAKASQKNLETWASAYKSYAAGDYVGAAKGLVAMHGDLPDGNTIVAADPVKDKDGNVTGFNMKVKNDATGETRAQFVDPKTLTEAGLQALSPQSMFESVYKRQQAVDAARMANAAKAADEARKLQGDIILKGVEAGYKEKSDIRLQDRQNAHDDRMDIRSAARDDARAARDEANIRLKASLENSFKKTTDPAERRAMIVTELSKNPLYANKTEEQINAAADKWMNAMQAGQNPKPSSIKPDATAPSGKSAAPAPDVSSLKDGYYRDTQTGDVFQVQGGKRLNGPAAPAPSKPAAPAPAPAATPAPATPPVSAPATPPTPATAASVAASGITQPRKPWAQEVAEAQAAKQSGAKAQAVAALPDIQRSYDEAVAQAQKAQQLYPNDKAIQIGAANKLAAAKQALDEALLAAR
jgi:hypothetical protein